MSYEDQGTAYDPGAVGYERVGRADGPAWEPYFAWRPVRLLTLEWAWFRWVRRRPSVSSFGYGGYDYAWLLPEREV